MPKGPVNWTNLNADGQRMNRIIKLCETNVVSHLEKGDHDLVLAYLDRLIKATHQKERLTDLVMGISHLRKVAEKKLDQPKMMLK